MAEYKKATQRRAHGFQVPANHRGPNATVVDIGGRPHLWDAVDGVLVNLEAIAEKIDPEDYKANKA